MNVWLSVWSVEFARQGGDGTYLVPTVSDLV
jgi:hypothetical protein